MRRALVALFAAASLAGCGGHEEHAGDGPAADPARAFLQAMVPHHESAIAMAQVALHRAEHEEVRRLAKGIVRAQEREIGLIHAIHQRLYDSPLEPDEAGHEALGLTAAEAGMGHGGVLDELEAAEPFDRAFIDGMIPHHEGAIRMAQAVVEDGGDPELLELARDIVSAQRREIRRMEAWRERWYADAVDAVPHADGHGGHGD